jgi:hypothetical protein
MIPNGVTKWEWDFNNDQIIDSTAQNPQFVFTGVGYDVKYTVSLKATDARTAPARRRRRTSSRQPVPGRHRFDLRRRLDQQVRPRPDRRRPLPVDLSRRP